MTVPANTNVRALIIRVWRIQLARFLLWLTRHAHKARWLDGATSVIIPEDVG